MSSLFKNKLTRYGLPFILFTVGGSFGLREFVELRFRYFKPDYIREEVAKSGIEMKPKGSITLETEFEKLQNVDIDDWKNVRVPRPWEEEDSANKK